MLRTALPTLAAATLLASCAAFRVHPPAPYPCPPGARCDVEVKVVEVVDGTCKIEFANPVQLELEMPARHRNVVIRWTLAPSTPNKYEFEADGFALKDAAGDGHQFKLKPAVVASGRAYQLTNLNSDTLTYAYKMRVWDADDQEHTRYCPIDPLIHNTN